VSRVVRFAAAVQVLMVAVAISVAWGTGATGGPVSQDVNLSLHSLGGPKDLIGLDLEYMGRTPTRIYKSDFPWGIRRSIILVVICLDGSHSVIPELEYIDDPEPAIVTLQPRQRYHGTISLAERFPTLSGCLTSRDALVFWSYQFAPIDATPSARLSGGVVVQRR
jgi:hypothetical protein